MRSNVHRGAAACPDSGRAWGELGGCGGHKGATLYVWYAICLHACVLVCVSVAGHESRKGRLYRGRGVQLMVMTGHCRARGTQYDRTLRYPCSPLPAFASNLLWFRSPRRSRCILRRSLGGMLWLSICAVDGWKTCGGPGEDLRRSCFSVLCMRCSGLAGSVMEPAA